MPCGRRKGGGDYFRVCTSFSWWPLESIRRGASSSAKQLFACRQSFVKADALRSPHHSLAFGGPSCCSVANVEPKDRIAMWTNIWAAHGTTLKRVIRRSRREKTLIVNCPSTVTRTERRQPSSPLLLHKYPHGRRYCNHPRFEACTMIRCRPCGAISRRRSSAIIAGRV